MDNSVYDSKEYEVIEIEESQKDAMSSYYKNLGSLLKKAREEQNFTLTDVAKYVDLTPTAISNYESGIRQIPIHMLLLLRDIYSKPLQYFLGPDIDLDFQLSKSLQKAVGNFTNTIYAKMVFKLEDGYLVDVKYPTPLIPLPPDIAKDHSFIFQEYCPDVESFNYTLFKFYKPYVKKIGFLIFKKRELVYIEPNPEDIVIAEIGDTKRFEVVKYKDVTPTSRERWKHDPRSVNVIAIATVKIERLVK